MAQRENQTQIQGDGNPQTAEETLKQLAEQLQNIVNQLQSENTRLSGEIEQLRSQCDQLQSQQHTEQQREIWNQQLAEQLAKHREELRQQQLNLIAASASHSNGDQNQNAFQLLSSFYADVSASLEAIQHEVGNRQSDISQQIDRMQSLQQQGEAILEALVTRMRVELQQTYPHSESNAPRVSPRRRSTRADRSTQSLTDQPQPQPILKPTPTVPEAPTPIPTQPSNFKLGVLLILFSSLMFSLQNIVVRVILKEQSLFGVFKLGGFITPSPGNSLLILLMRMLIVAPVMAFVIAPLFYQHTWRDIKHLGKKNQLGRLLCVVGSGFFLFLSQFFIYIALGNVPTGVATTIFFVYPTITILLAWLIFREKPTFLLVLATISIYIGGFLTIPSFTAGAKGNVTLGATTAIASGVAFAIYVILIKVSRLHPIPFSVVSFTTILFLSALVLQFVGYQVVPSRWPTLWMATLVLATTTLVGYILNNIAVPMICPALASVVSASGPALTAMLALVIIQEKLQLYQVLGVVLVTLWVIGISAQNLKPKAPPAQPAAK